MSQRIKISTDQLDEIGGILLDANGDFESARRRIAVTLNVNLEEGGKTELGELYAEGLRPGAFATAALLDLIRDILEGAGGNTFGIATLFKDAASAAESVTIDGRGSGGRR